MIKKKRERERDVHRHVDHSFGRDDSKARAREHAKEDLSLSLEAHAEACRGEEERNERSLVRLSLHLGGRNERKEFERNASRKVYVSFRDRREEELLLRERKKAEEEEAHVSNASFLRSKHSSSSFYILLRCVPSRRETWERRRVDSSTNVGGEASEPRGEAFLDWIRTMREVRKLRRWMRTMETSTDRFDACVLSTCVTRRRKAWKKDPRRRTLRCWNSSHRCASQKRNSSMEEDGTSNGADEERGKTRRFVRRTALAGFRPGFIRCETSSSWSKTYRIIRWNIFERCPSICLR